MKFDIALLPGDGIGPEVTCQAVKSVEAVCRKFGHEVSWHFAYAGACAIDRYGDAFPEVTYKTCKDADAVLFGAVGDPKYDNDPTAKVRPEQGLPTMRGAKFVTTVPSGATTAFTMCGSRRSPPLAIAL